MEPFFQLQFFIGYFTLPVSRLIKQTVAIAAACIFLEFRQKCRLNSKAQKFFVEFRDLTRPVLLAG